MADLFKDGPAKWLADRRAAELAYYSTPAMIEWQEAALRTMRINAAMPDTGPRFAVGAEMDRTPSQQEIIWAEARLAECRAYVAELESLAA